MVIRSSSGFSHLRPGVFHIFFGHTKHNKYNREGGRKEKKTNKHGLGLAPKKGEVCDTFLTFCKLSWACIRAKFPQSHQESWFILSRWPTRPLSPQALAPVFFYWLPCSASFVDWFLLLSAFFCRLLPSEILPSLFLFRSRGRSCAQALCVGFAPKQIKGSSDWHPHPHPQIRKIGLRTSYHDITNHNGCPVVWGYRIHRLLSIGYRSYRNQTWPIKWNAVSSRQRSYRYCCMDALLGR